MPVQDVSGPGTAYMELDQAAHRAIGVAAALVTTWLTLRKGGRRWSPPPHPAGMRPCLRRDCPPRP
ncbi:hypothetical protein OHT20_04985 [Streptomyces caniferus]|uniref:hypothetical protein n=1 Tax=Streptomyces caniferus TaxID=285557 RepID=UPI002E2E1EBB|nr:hypothetical protein [Streptomyces caniferus]